MLQKMGSAMVHRGPDDGRVWLNESSTVGLAHQRLAIIDLSEEAGQPMHYNNRYTIAYNGEIYNYIELRDELIRSGVQFKTKSDTEVLLALYDTYGYDCLAKLDGMFAFAIYDAVENHIFLARDRVGEKPLFYLKNKEYVVFGSEIKSFFPFVKPGLDTMAIGEYICSGKIIYDNTTYFKQVKSLNRASWKRISAGGEENGSYWSVNITKQIRYSKDEDYFLHFRQLFDESVKRRLRSDVEVGSSLSGGIDSSSIVCSVSQQSELRYKTFSARFPGSIKDEGQWIDAVVSKTEVENISIYPEASNMISRLKELLWHQEFLIGSASIFAQFEVMKKVREQKVKVLLDGQGADEYLAGYDNLKYYTIWDAYRNLNCKRFFHESKLLKTHFNNASSGWMFLLDPILLPFGLKRKAFKNGTSLKEQLQFSVTTTLSELLRYADRNSMASSVEVRLPFTYHALIDFVMAIPDDLIYRDAKTKFILRESLRDILPESIYSRTDKIGFVAPQNNWISTPVWQQEYQRSLSVLNKHDIQIDRADNFRSIIAANFIETFSG